MIKNKWAIMASLFALWAIIASLFAGYYWYEYTTLEERVSGISITLNIGVDYRNGTRTFYNNTQALSGETLFDVTKSIVDIEHDAGYILSINNVSEEGDFGWTFWIWNDTEQAWDIVWKGADSYKLLECQTIMWYYTDYITFDPPP